MDEFASKTLKRVRSVRTERLHLVSTANLPTPAMEQAAIVTGSKPPKTTMLLRAVPPPEAAVVDEETDLVPGVYEGGLKVWECSVDLIEYMLDRPEVYGPEKMAGKRVIELGCGHGLPGVYALRQGAHVVFTDYNREVLEHATIPNVRANCPEALPSSLSIDTSGGRGGGMSAGQGSAQGVVNAGGRAAFYFGDWGGLPEMLADDGEERFDLILTAETLYTATATVQIHRLIETLLAPGGHALVAAKRYYFGCGGSCAHFKQLVAPPMACETACVIDTGVANIREVLLVSWGGGGGGAVTATAGGGAGLTEAMHEDEEEDVQE
ncbi:hypothetical protein JKP88DRAFT_353472 [Tribonema minus]|uniref:protein-histidine N-methyltransferase n=1 Tax=Tribonema minus TaxID=303371 RepID=A0A835Z957_9STRA|nr:hypothetical protein JKP88DRAFT_353472 [Tribonema minus]